MKLGEAVGEAHCVCANLKVDGLWVNGNWNEGEGEGTHLCMTMFVNVNVSVRESGKK